MRRELVLKAMLDQSMITQAQFVEANAATLPKAENVRLPGTEGTGAALRRTTSSSS